MFDWSIYDDTSQEEGGVKNVYENGTNFLTTSDNPHLMVYEPINDNMWVSHISGINNEMADWLSRFKMKLFEINGNPILRPLISNDTNNKSSR